MVGRIDRIKGQKMAENNRQPTTLRITLLACLIVVLALLIWRSVYHRPSLPLVSEPAAKETSDAKQPEVSIKQIIKAAKSWEPAYQSWFDKQAPDFKLIDLNGKEHKLSDYHGRDILLVFWATWCPPCRMEVPLLIALRNTITEDKLAILAISNEDPAIVKKFADYNKINYTVILDQGGMPQPYNSVNSIPSSFFIKPDGTIKLVTVGTLSLGQIQTILAAK